MKRKRLQAAAAVLAISAMAGDAVAETVCAGAQDLTALQVASVQQELMVAALACEADNVTLYNEFVTTYQPELVSSDEALLAYFLRRAPSTGTDEYHAFKTRLANHFSSRSADDRPGFCHKAEALFHEALAGRKKSLAAFALAQPMVIDANYTVCGDTVKGESFASAAVIREEAKPQVAKAAEPVLAAAPPLVEAPSVVPARENANSRAYAENLAPAPVLAPVPHAYSAPPQRPAQSTCSRMSSGYLDCYYGDFHYYRDPFGRFLPPPSYFPRSN